MPAALLVLILPRACYALVGYRFEPAHPGVAGSVDRCVLELANGNVVACEDIGSAFFSDLHTKVLDRLARGDDKPLIVDRSDSDLTSDPL